jgi:hypothetical protein
MIIIYILYYNNNNNNYYIYTNTIAIIIVIIYIYKLNSISPILADFFVHCFAFISLQMIPAESGTTLKTDDLVFCREHHGL